MGTNYYAEYNICPCCHHPERILHIGKRSGGWQFSFQGYDGEEGTEDIPGVELKSWQQYRAFLARADVSIYDEYGNELALGELEEVVEGTRGNQNHFDYCVQTGEPASYIAKLWKDAEGYSFSSCEFS